MIEDKERELIQQTGTLIKKDLDINLENNFISEEQLEEALADKIYDLIQNQLERLFSILYRLDINEAKVHYALKMNELIPAHFAIARLIIAREKQKIISRQKYKYDKDDDVESW